MKAKEQILARIRDSKVPPIRANRPLVMTLSERSREEIVEQFIDFAAEYKAVLTRCASEEIGLIVADRLNARSVGSILVPVDLPPSWIPSGIEHCVAGSLTYHEIEKFGGVLTGCKVAIAETGTIVLDCGPTQGERVLSLLPDLHLCVVLEHQILDSVAEAVQALEPSVKAGQPLTWISGPSATSDIELNRVEGVHGPRQLEILVAKGN